MSKHSFCREELVYDRWIIMKKYNFLPGYTCYYGSFQLSRLLPNSIFSRDDNLKVKLRLRFINFILNILKSAVSRSIKCFTLPFLKILVSLLRIVVNIIYGYFFGRI